VACKECILAVQRGVAIPIFDRIAVPEIEPHLEAPGGALKEPIESPYAIYTADSQ